jgi:hypothetical protein
MSPSGYKLTFSTLTAMSAFRPRAEIADAAVDVSF